MANTRRNKVRDDDEEVSAPKRKRNKPKKSGSGLTDRVRTFLSDRRTHKVVGLALMVGAAYLLVAFISYLFTWKEDQDLMNRSWRIFLDPSVRVENWLGKLGALLAYRFIAQWFGIAAFGLVLWSFLTGARILLRTWLLPVKRTLAWTALAMVWVPALLGFMFRTGDAAFLGGGLGLTINAHLTSMIGNFGTGTLLLFTLGGFLVYTFDPSFHWIMGLFQRKEEMTEQAPTDADGWDVVKGNRIREEEAAEAPATELSTEEVPEASAALELEMADPEPEPLVEATTEEPDPSLSDLNSSDEEFSVQVAESDEQTLSEDELEKRLQEFGEYDPKLDLSSYELPPIDLLVDHGTGELTVTKEELEANKDNIVRTLGHYNIGIERIKATIGPTVTLYEIIPQAGVRISKIKNLEDDIALSLAALGIRIIAPIPGKGTIGIEVPNSKPQVVGMRAVVASDKFQNSTADLPIVLGKTISNETFVTDLARMPHLLMAGATGQGKSVGLNAILVSLLYKKHPSQIKFVLVDPKKVELTLFNKIERHFLAKLPGSEEAIITDTKKVVATLNSLCIEMDERYELLKQAGVRNIKEYNTKFIKRRLNPENGHRYLPYIVLVVDEFADLIMTAGREVETPIARLAQLARAIGIHLIIATQRPSVNIITGTIKANFPARIAFRVTSKVDSRTILDSGGADQLIGRGDMLLSTGNDLIRIQCAFVDTPEVEQITEFIGGQRGYPEALILPEVPTEEGDGAGLDDGERDSMFEEAARLVVQTQQGSTSLIQRKLKLGYNRAGRIVDQLEAAGILGPFEGSKARRVMIPNEAALEAHLNADVSAGPGMGGF
ncbi:MAG: DNA translocase FtsK 4TM domain-containing protein [Flavobacteriales bacterium]|nr:DNA translocase FtsK 4TM domain-containing protein [Flavobacteriales bacterium]